MQKATQRMLIVDDEAGILKTFKDLFETRNWRTLTAPTGTTALEIIKKEPLDIVLLDVRLPDKSGIETLKEIKSLKPLLPVIIVTALGYEDDLVNEALRCGASGYVSKNVPLRELISVINNTLAQ